MERRDTAVLQVILHERQKSYTGKCEDFPSFFVKKSLSGTSIPTDVLGICPSAHRYHPNSPWCFSSATFTQCNGK